MFNNELKNTRVVIVRSYCIKVCYSVEFQWQSVCGSTRNLIITYVIPSDHQYTYNIFITKTVCFFSSFISGFYFFIRSFTIIHILYIHRTEYMYKSMCVCAQHKFSMYLIFFFFDCICIFQCTMVLGEHFYNSSIFKCLNVLTVRYMSAIFIY